MINFSEDKQDDGIDSWSGMVLASQFGKRGHKAVDFLIRTGHNIERRESKDRKTALMMASYRGRIL